MSFTYQLMGGGYRIGRFLGIDVRLNRTWFLTAGILLLLFATEIGGVFALPLAAAFVLLLFASVLAHEYGHALAARHYGIQTRAITLHGLGGLAQIEAEPKRPTDEIVVAAAGPAVSFVLAGLGFAAWVMLGFVAPALAFVAWWVGWLNLILGAFNLLPGIPLDGGRILRGILWARSGDRARATLTAASWGIRVGQGLMLLGVLGMFGLVAFGGITTVLVGWFVYSAASSERRRMMETGGRMGLDGLVRMWQTMSPRSGPAAGPAAGPTAASDVARVRDTEVVRLPDGREVHVPRPRR